MTEEQQYDVMFRSVQSGAIRTLFEALKEVLVDVNITSIYIFLTMENVPVCNVKFFLECFLLLY